MPVYYNGFDIRPGPFVTINKEYVRSEDGRLKRVFFNIVAKGKLVASKGSPDANGNWYTGGSASEPAQVAVAASDRMAAIEKQQGAIIQLFKQEGKLFEILPWNGSAPIRFNPRIKSIDFGEGKWVDTCDFTIQMEADTVWWGSVMGGGEMSANEPEESWSIEVESSDNRSYRVSHTCSSQQRASFDENGNVTKKGWENARDVVLPKTGVAPDQSMLPPVAQGNYLVSNYTRSQSIDESAGRFSVTENWTYTYGQRYIEEFSVSTKVGADGTNHVTVDGTITGYVQPDPTLDALQWAADKYANALNAWETLAKPNLHARAQNYSGVVLNPVVLSTSLTKSPVKGTITYSWEYDNRPTNLIPGSISESLTISYQNPTDVVAQLVVLGRAAGPILQSIGTVTAKQKSVNFEVVMMPQTYGQPLPAQPNVSSVITPLYPGGYVSRDEESWTPKSGRYSRSVSWTYE